MPATKQRPKVRLIFLQIFAGLIGIGYALVMALFIGLAWPSVRGATFVLVAALYILATCIAPEEVGVKA